MKLSIKNTSLVRLWENIVCRHIIYWMGGFAFFFLIVRIWEPLPAALEIATIIILPGFIPVYLHIYIFKIFFEQRKYALYVLALILVIIGAQFSADILVQVVINDPDTHTSGAGTAIFFIVFTTAFKYYKKGIKQQFRLQEAESKQLQTELALLKSQVNPHFFFNTLNNLYALSLDKSERVPEVILKISDLMRYVLESSNNKEVELNREIHFLENYLSLERLRLSTHSDIKFNVVGNMNGKIIAPMILIPFIENSFKHGVSASASSNYVHIELKMEGNDLHFSIENNKQEHNKTDEQSSSKSGLKNVKRRLELLYPDRHKLDIEENENSYKVNLKIKL